MTLSSIVKRDPVGVALATGNAVAPIADAGLPGPKDLGPPTAVFNVELAQPMGWPEALVWLASIGAVCFLIAIWVRAMNGRL